MKIIYQLTLFACLSILTISCITIKKHKKKLEYALSNCTQDNDCNCRGTEKYWKGYIYNIPNNPAYKGLIALDISPNSSNSNSWLPACPFSIDTFNEALVSTRRDTFIWQDVFFKIDCTGTAIEVKLNNVQTVSTYNNTDILIAKSNQCFPFDLHDIHVNEIGDPEHRLGHIWYLNRAIFDKINNSTTDEIEIDGKTYQMNLQFINKLTEINNSGKNLAQLTDYRIDSLSNYSFSLGIFSIDLGSGSNQLEWKFLPNIEKNISKNLYAKELKYSENGPPKHFMEAEFKIGVISSFSIYHDHGTKVTLPW